jgi:signal transduction histidine kinase
VYERLFSARPIEEVLRLVVVVFRVGAYVWMIGLVVTTFVTDTNANLVQVSIATVIGLLATIGTVVAARQKVLGTRVYALVDGSVILYLAWSPMIAGADDLFYGGMVTSWLFVGALAGGSAWALLGGTAIGVLQVVGAEVLWPRSMTLTQATGLIFVYVIPAIVVGWAFDTLRYAARLRNEAQAALADARAQQARDAERADVATRLHDSVLQTLSVIEGRTAEPETRHLARKERHAMRALIDSLSFDADHSFKGLLREQADHVEDTYLVSVESAFVGNDGVDARLELLCKAAGEAMVNAAKHSGCERISLFAEVADDRALVTVKDEGRGVDDRRLIESVQRSLGARIAPCGGRVRIESTPHVLTVVEIAIPRGDGDHGC